jgi:hypothetical protein
MRHRGGHGTPIYSKGKDHRAVLDGEFARFFGFLPQLGAGVDVLRVAAAGDVAAATKVVPVVTVGLARNAF